MNPAENRPGLVRHDHGPTARDAARRIEPKSGTQRALVLDAIRRAGIDGLTRDEIADRLHLPQNSVRPRVKELLDHGWLTVTMRTRLSSAGSPAEVLIARELIITPADKQGAPALFTLEPEPHWKAA